VTGWLIAFLLLALAGAALIIGGIYVLAGLGSALIAGGVAALICAAVAHRAAFA
jgi:predicted phage tail protein